MANPSGKYILGSDLDFLNIEIKTIKAFEGYLINPYQYKIKNIKTSANALFNEFNGYIDGLRLEDCGYTPSSDLCILYKENVDGRGIIKNIQMKNCNIEINEECTEKIKIKLGSSSFISKCLFEGTIISKNAPIEFYFYGSESREEESFKSSMIKNSYCILEAANAKSLKYILPGCFMYSTYHVLTGTVELVYCAFRHMSIENLKNKGLVLNVWAPDTVMENYIIFQELTHEEGRFPYLS